MSRIIFKCPYIKPGTEKSAAHLNSYIRYIATRAGVELVPSEKAGLPATKKQRAMVERLLRDFPMCRGMFEYKDYQSSPTRAAASEFIARAIEDNYNLLAKRENYVSYIAQRPRAEHVGVHGLFNGTGDTLVLSKISEEIAYHPGNVWLPIISLRREDAARLGYDNARQWQALLSAYAPQIAEAMKIPWDQFRWYAAFHDEGTHPHVHMVCYSADGHSGFLDKAGITKIKSGLAQNIFRQELTEIYRQQTQRRDALVQQSGEAMKELTRQMLSGTLENPHIERLMNELAQRLKNTSGKKQYGYLQAPLKAIVDEIVDKLARDPRVAAAYDLWCQQREEVLRTYRDDLPDRFPLSKQKEFKRIKNLVIQEAVRLGEYREVFSPADTQEEDPASEDAVLVDRGFPAGSGGARACCQAAKDILRDPDAKPEQVGRAVIWFSQAAEQGNRYAMYALGMLYLKVNAPAAALRWFQQSAELGNQFAQYRLGKLLLTGDDVSKNTADTVRWLTESAEQGNQHAQYALGKLCLLGKDVPQDRDAAIRWLTLAAEQGSTYAQYFLDHMDDAPSLFSGAARLLHHMGRIFQEQIPPLSGEITFVDSKLRRKMQEKRLRMVTNQMTMRRNGGDRDMKIGLLDVDGCHWPSLPQMKLSAYHKQRGDTVEKWFPMNHYDTLYVSEVFTHSPDEPCVFYADEIVQGGTGYFYPDGGPPLPDAIEHCYPDYSLYGALTENMAYGFLTRGCPRNCGFCIVSKKEGRSVKQVADLSEFWRGQREVKLLDPNLLACLDREKLLGQLAESHAAVDFTQGLDIRLVNGIEPLILSLRIKRLHFAWDDPSEDLRPCFQRFQSRTGLPRWKMIVYVLTNFGSTHEQDLERIYFLRDTGYDPYVMVYERDTAPKETKHLQRWVNNRRIFRACPRFEEYRP